MLKIYHNPRCSKSRAALAYLEEQGQEFEIREYLVYHITESELENILTKLNYKASELVRRNEADFKENKLKGASEELIFTAMLNYPKLIERPIIVSEEAAVVARPLEKLVEFLEENK